MPVGRKHDLSTGTVFDFDQTYRTFIRPAILDAGLSPLTAEEFNSGAIIHRAALELVIRAYAFIADISTANPNVMYELGIRHALRRGLTVLTESRVI